MAQRHYLNLASGTIEVTSRVATEGWELEEKAEEGAVGQSTLWIADHAKTLDIDGLRAYYVQEDTSESTDNVLFGGFVADPELSRGEQGGPHYDPVGRMWQIPIVDRNSYWNRRVMVGTDCKRPAETDVARTQWLYATTEANWIDDASTYVSTASASAMDKVDYRGQYLNQVIDDGAQHTGKNWWVQFQYTGAALADVAWYGKDSLTGYSSPLYLSNDPTDWADSELLAGTSLVWPLADDTKLRRDLSRVYSGVYLRYANGTKAIYRRSASTVTAYGHRDYVADYPNVKTKAKAIARATRLLADLATPDERITTTVELPAAKATKIRAGMRIQVKATHLVGYTTWHWMRVLSCKVSPVAAGEKYKLTLTLLGPGVASSGPAPLAVGFLGTVVSGGWPNDAFWSVNLEADGVEVLSAAQLAANQGNLITFAAPVRASTWRLHMTLNWDTVFMPDVNFNHAVLLGAAGTDLLGNGWTPGGTNTTAITSLSSQDFVASGPSDGFSLDGYLNGSPVNGYTSRTVDQTGQWSVNQTDIISNVVRTMHYYWTWTL